MKTTRKDSVTGYKLDFSTNTLTINYKFNKALSDFGSPEYNRYKAILADFPNLTVVVKAGREITTTRRTKRLTYENMETYMGCFENSEALLRRFALVQKRSKALASPYKYVRDWLERSFPITSPPPPSPRTSPPSPWFLPLTCPCTSRRTRNWKNWTRQVERLRLA